MTKRININKNDEPALIAERIIEAEAETIVLNIPKFSRLAAAAVNFKLLKRQADVLKKTIIIESIDENVLLLAKKTGLEAINPFFAKPSGRKFSDIVVKSRTSKTKAKREKAKPFKVQPAILHQEEALAGPQVVESLLPEHLRENASPKPVRYQAKRRFNFFSRKTLSLGIAIIVLILFGYLAMAVLPRAQIVVKAQKKAWAFNGPVQVDKNLAAIDLEKTRIPGELFVQKNNVNLKFAAHGTKSIEKKATGKIIIFNAYSSQPQSLVANTRFQTPEGRVFRLRTAIIVPAAQIKDGKISPSSIEAEIIADKAGAEYNLGQVAKLTIPGFAGSAKFSGFYGQIKEPTVGGFVGEAQIATNDDIVKAKADSSRTLESSIRTTLASQIPNDFKVLDGSSKFTITKQTIDEVGDADGNFSIFTEGEVAAMAFQEKDVLLLLVSKISTQEEFDYQVRHLELNYELSDASDPYSGKITIGVNYRGELSRTIDEKTLLQNVRGQSEDGLKGIVAAISGVESAEVSLWPFWVRKVPDNLEKIKLTVE